MKSIAIAALLATAQAVRVEHTYLTMTDGSVRDVVALQTAFIDKSDEIIQDTNAVQLEESKVEELKDEFQGYTPSYDGFEGNNHNGGEWRDAYKRVIPEHFTGETADTFTAKMIKEYAFEGKDKDTGKPNGKFTVTKAQTKKAAYEVLETHLGLKGADADKHLAKYFDQVWNHFDVLEKGALEAVELNKFMRDLCKPVKEHITLE